MVDIDNNDELTVEEQADKDYKKLYADSTKESQLLMRENRVLRDPNEFIKLYNSDKRQATEVATRNDFDDADSMLKFIEEEWAKWTDTWNLDDLAEKLEAINEGKKVTALVDSFMAERKIDPETELGKAFLAEYKDYAGQKKLTVSKATKYLKIAFNEVKGNNQYAEEYSKKMREMKAAGVSWGSQKAVEQPKKTTYIRNKSVSLGDLPQYNG